MADTRTAVARDQLRPSRPQQPTAESRRLPLECGGTLLVSAQPSHSREATRRLRAVDQTGCSHHSFGNKKRDARERGGP